MLRIFLALVFGIFNLPLWATEYAKPPLSCEAFHSSIPGRDLMVGYCYLIDSGPHVSTSNGVYWPAHSSFVTVGTLLRIEP